MNKEEAKIKLRTELRDMDVSPEQTVKMGDLIGTTIDAIESEHKPVVLPEEAGKWIDYCKHDLISISDALNHNAPVHGAFGNEMPVKVIQWLYDNNHQLLFAQGYLDGWLPEPEQKWFIRVPHTKLANGRSQWYGKNNKGNSCFASKELLNGVEVQRAINTAWMFSKADIDDFDLEDCERVEVDHIE